LTARWRGHRRSSANGCAGGRSPDAR
jgi:hypothetical protein